MTKPSIHVTPEHPRIDEAIFITIVGCQPNQELTLRALLKDDANEQFTSWATFRANESGEISLAQNAPESGSYQSIDQAGIIWSMTHHTKANGHYFTKTTAEPLKVTLRLEANHQTINETAVAISFYTDRVIKREMRSNGAVGTLYQPIDQAATQNVMLLAGSDGGRLEHAATMLAAKGYNVLDLAYFNQDGVPKNLENIPLEYFHGAIQVFKEMTENEEKISVIGYSRGAELALLLASTYDEFNAVIAGAPGAYVTSGLKNSIYAPIQSWTLADKPIPYFKFTYRPSVMFSFFRQWMVKKPASFLGIWESSLKAPEKNEAARIKVENIKAPVLLLTGGDDQVWPAAHFAKLMKNKLPQLEWKHYEQAGHFLSFPYALPNMPANLNEHVGGRMTMQFGGTAEANALAAADSLPHIFNFLESSSVKESVNQ